MPIGFAKHEGLSYSLDLASFKMTLYMVGRLRSIKLSLRYVQIYGGEH